MNRKQIIAELRRSATEDASPWDCEPFAFSIAIWNWQELCESALRATYDDLRTFYLLVACALEDEQ